MYLLFSLVIGLLEGGYLISAQARHHTTVLMDYTCSSSTSTLGFVWRSRKTTKTIIVRVTLHVTTSALALGGTCTEFQLLTVQRVCWSDLKLDLGQISIHPQSLSAYLVMTAIHRLQILVCRVELLQAWVL